MESTVSDYSASGTKRRRTGSALPAIAPSNVYPCRDGEYLIGANQDGLFARLAAAMGRPELASDERYATHRERGTRQEEHDALSGESTKPMTIDELEAKMLKAAAPGARVGACADRWRAHPSAERLARAEGRK